MSSTETEQQRTTAQGYLPLPKERRLLWMSELNYAPPSQISEEEQYARAVQESLSVARPNSCPPPISSSEPVASSSSATQTHHYGFRHRFHRSKSPGPSLLASEPVARPLSGRSRTGTTVSTSTTGSTSSGFTSSSSGEFITEDIPSYEEAVSSHPFSSSSKAGSAQHFQESSRGTSHPAVRGSIIPHNESASDINAHSRTPTLFKKLLHRHKLL